MKIVPLAFDSFSTRSMATYVETKDCKILIDPGISIAPLRFSLPPHPLELERLEEDRLKIKEYCKKADIFILTHYHYDHHDPNEPEIWKGKIALIKHPTEKINFSQKGRAAHFIPLIKDIVKGLEYCDGREFKFGNTRIVFSNPVFHGPSARLGYVTQVLVVEGREKFVHTSDVEGPALDNQTEFIIESNPHVLILDGPLSYIMYRYGSGSLRDAVKNMLRIIEKTDVKKFLIDHHFLRDLKWREIARDVFASGKESRCIVSSVAEYLGVECAMLEANRKRLFREKPAKVKIIEEKFPIADE